MMGAVKNHFWDEIEAQPELDDPDPDYAQGIEARRVETGTGSIEDESPVPNGDAPKG